MILQNIVDSRSAIYVLVQQVAFPVEFKHGFRIAVCHVNVFVVFGNEHAARGLQYVIVDDTDQIALQIADNDSSVAGIGDIDLIVIICNIRFRAIDIAGIRIICSFTSDIYRMADMIGRQNDLTVFSDSPSSLAIFVYPPPALRMAAIRDLSLAVTGLASFRLQFS